jgi:type IV fimbrial biogenesis protein FimT
MQAGLALARNEALRRNARVSLWLVNGITGTCARTSAGASWVVSIDNPVNKCADAASDTVAPRLVQSRAGSDGSTGVSVSAVDAASPAVASSCVTFNGFGRVEASCVDGGAPISRINVESASAPADTRRLQVQIESGGSVRTCDRAVTSSSDPAYC